VKKIILIILIVMACLPQVYASDPEAATIRREMKHLKGEALLQAYSNLCRLAAAGDDSRYELKCIRDYLAEAMRQHDVEAEGLARSTQMNCYYNYDMDDSLKKELPACLAALAKNKTWDYYFNSWNVLVEMYMYQDKLQTALNESKKMYNDARKNKSNYGLGVASYCMGGIYQTMGQFKEAEKALKESVAMLSKEEDISLLLSAYNALGETLDGLGKYNELRTMATAWKSVLDQYQKKALAKGYTPALSGRYLYCTLAAAVAEIETRHYPQAAQLLKQAEKYAEGRKQIARFKLLQVESRYYAATKQYDKAIACNSENMKIVAEAGDSVSLLTVEEQQADYLFATGKYKDAASMYQSFIKHKDKISNAKFAKQLDEMRTIYEVDKLTLNKEMANNRFYFSIAVCALLLIVIVLYIIYTHRLRRKNRILFDTITQSRKFQESLLDSESVKNNAQLDGEGLLYHRLCNIMKEEQLFKDPDIKREDLAAKLNTNRTYLADAVKKFADGITITEFINSYRLRYSAKLLAENPSLPINDVMMNCGFNSRSTFSRLFRDMYGMSPTEYRNISKEKQKRM
jgi:AraC-like DNA-binding protein